MNNLIDYERLGLTTDKLEIIKQYVYYKEQVETFENDLKDAFKTLVETGLPVNSVDLGNIILSYKKGFTKKSVDTEKLKEDGLYDQYLKETEVNSTVIMKIKKEKEND